MTSQRKRKRQQPAPKPRNPLVVPAQQRKAGAHRKSRSAQRQQARQTMRKEWDESNEP